MTVRVPVAPFPSPTPLTAISDEMLALRERVTGFLPDIDLMCDEQIKDVLRTYEFMIGQHFIPWMLATWLRCKSTVAIEACRDNLVCEIIENHPKMLHDFVRGITDWGHGPARLNAMTHGAVLCDNMYKRIRSDDAMDGLLIMACLENASIEFIPWLAAAGRRVGVSNFTYTDKHGIDDIQHANQFIEAVNAEAYLLRAGHRDYTSANPIQYVEGFLYHIFQAHKVSL